MPIRSPRPLCGTCLRAQRACICRWVTPLAAHVEVAILQHPLEVAHAKGSARLLHLCLPHSRLLVGETFAEATLRRLLRAPFDGGAVPSSALPAALPVRQPLLLYPQTPDSDALGMAPPPALEASLLQAPHRLRLVVLDGTWRKSRKMLYLNPLLQQLPRLHLDDAPASRYLIRKAQGAHQLSTFEAVCHALMRLENNDEKYQPLLDAFSGFVAQQHAQRLAAH